METAEPKIEINREGPITVVELMEEKILEEGPINELAKQLFQVVADNPGINLLLSFARVKHFSSALLGTLIRLNKRVSAGGGILKLCQIRASLLEVFEITKLNKVFEIYRERTEALLSYEAENWYG
jgi:anti-sigma B factor antagonist